MFFNSYFTLIHVRADSSFIFKQCSLFVSVSTIRAFLNQKQHKHHLTVNKDAACIHFFLFWLVWEIWPFVFLIINTADISGICLITFLWVWLSKVGKQDTVISISGLNSFQYRKVVVINEHCMEILLYLVGYTLISGKGIFDFFNVSGPNQS